MHTPSLRLRGRWALAPSRDGTGPNENSPRIAAGAVILGAGIGFEPMTFRL